ncbi:MAG: FecR domain-containing protein, partial [Bacteroidota bacterium]
MKNFKITLSYRIIVLLIFLLLTVKFVHSQEVQEFKITKTFNRTPITEFFSYLEETCGITFFYREEWIKSFEINGTFKNTPLSQILNQVFKEKELNFKFFEKDMVFVYPKRTDGNVLVGRNESQL